MRKWAWRTCVTASLLLLLATAGMWVRAQYACDGFIREKFVRSDANPHKDWMSVITFRSSVEFTSARALLLGAAIATVTALLAVGVSFIELTPAQPAQPAQSIQSAPGHPPRPGLVGVARPISGVLLALALVTPVAYVLCLAMRG